MFHIIEDAPVRYRRSFWVSRLNEDGTDAGVGAIPNTERAQEWLNEQGNSECLQIKTCIISCFFQHLTLPYTKR